jgi:ketosteroid isomerase-like protein
MRAHAVYGREQESRMGRTTVTTVAERNVASVEAYYKAMNDKDVASVARHLHPDVQFIGPMANLAGKEAVLEAAKRFISFISGIRIHAKFGSEDQAMLTSPRLLHGRTPLG